MRFKSRASNYDASMLVNITAPSAQEAWLRVLRVIDNNPALGDSLLSAGLRQKISASSVK